LNISLVEYGDYEVWPLPSTLELEKSSNVWKEKLGLRQSPLQIAIRNNQKSIRAVGVTGFVCVNGVDIEIKPKFLATATNDKWRKMLWNILLFVESSSDSLFGEHSVDETDEDSHFLDLLGWVFLSSIKIASLEGFPRGYVERRESSREIKGSIDYSQITAFMQKPFTFPCIYDEYSEDISVNRLLKWAGTLLSHQVKSSRLSNLILDNLQHIAANSGIVPGIVEAEHITLPAQYNYVESALKIAKMLLRNKSLHFEQGLFNNSGFLWKSHQVYEDLLHKILLMSMRYFGNRYTLQREKATIVANPFYCTTQKIDEYPDFKMKHGNEVVCILDAKYKRNNVRRSNAYGLANTEDINQIIVACKIEKCLHGVLVYPSENGQDSHHQTWRINDEGFPKYISNLYLNIEVMGEREGAKRLSKQMFDQVEILLSYR